MHDARRSPLATCSHAGPSCAQRQSERQSPKARREPATDERKARPLAHSGSGPEPAPPAGIVSDAQAVALGFPSPRAFREAVKRQRIPFVRVGQRMLVTVADLQQLARVHDDDRPELATPDDEHELDADDVLAELGLRRA